MKPVTQSILTAALAGDDTITDEQAQAVISFLSGSVVALHRDRVVPVSEAAQRLGKGARTIRRYCVDGLLKGYKPRQRTTGVYESSLALLGV